MSNERFPSVGQQIRQTELVLPNRRQWLRRMGNGFGSLALTGLLAEKGPCRRRHTEGG